jgi:hypothetical protein
MSDEDLRAANMSRATVQQGMVRTMKFTALVMALAFVPGLACAQKWGPTWSEVTGELYSRTELNRTGAIIKSIDGRQSLDKVVRSDVGQRKVVVQSPTRTGLRGSDVTLDMTLEPCKRYYINAQFKSGVGTDWEPVIAQVEAIAGCKLP